MADNDVLQLHFSIDTKDAEDKIKRVSNALESIVKDGMGEVNKQASTLQSIFTVSNTGASGKQTYMSAVDDIAKKLRTFHNSSYQISSRVDNEIKLETKAIDEAVKALGQSITALGGIKDNDIGTKVIENIGQLSQKLNNIPEQANGNLEKLSSGMSGLKDSLSGISVDTVREIQNLMREAGKSSGKYNVSFRLSLPKASDITGSETFQERLNQVQSTLNSMKPLSMPVELVFGNGDKTIESAKKAAEKAKDKSKFFSEELNGMKVLRDQFSLGVIDAETFKAEVEKVSMALMPRKKMSFGTDETLLPQVDKIIAELEAKSSKLTDAAQQALARSTLMISGNALEAFQMDVQAKLNALKPLEFTNIKIKASKVDVAAIKDAEGLEALANNAKLLKTVALKVSRLDVSAVDKINNIKELQNKFNTLVDLVIPISQVTFKDDLKKVKDAELKENIETIGNKLVLPIYQADLSKVKPMQSGVDVSKKISDLAQLVAYLQSIDLSQAKITNEQDLYKRLEEFGKTLKERFSAMGKELSQDINIPFLDQKNINRLYAYANALKAITSNMKWLRGLEKQLERVGVAHKDITNSIIEQTRREAENQGLGEEGKKHEDDIRAKAAERAAATIQKSVKDAFIRGIGEGWISLGTGQFDKAKAENVFNKMFSFVTREGIEEYTDKAVSKATVKPVPITMDDSKTVEKFKEYWRMMSGFDANALQRLSGLDDDWRKVIPKAHAYWHEIETAKDMTRQMGAESEASLKRIKGTVVDVNGEYQKLVKLLQSNGTLVSSGTPLNIAGLNVTELKRLQLQMRTTGDTFTEMMRGMGFYLSGRTVVSFFRDAISSASAFAMEIRRIQSLATTFDFDRLKTGLASIDARFGNLVHNAKALYWAFSSGVRGTEEELVRFTETMSKTAITIGSDVMPVMDAATTLMNAYGKSAASAGEISDLLFTIVKEGKANGQQLAGSLGNIIAPASAMGLTFKDIGATISTLTRTMKTNNALTYLNNILSKMNNPTQEVQKQLDKLGLEINATAIKAKGFAQVMREIHEATRGNINVIAKLFPDIRGQRAAVTLFSTQFKEFQKQINNFDNMSGNMQEALQKITDNPEAQFAALKNSLAMIKQAAGDAAIGFITFGGVVNGVFEKINGLKSTGRMIVGTVLNFGAIGVALTMFERAKAMFDYAQLNTVIQTNKLYQEQTQLIIDSAMAIRNNAAAEANAKAANLDAYQAQMLADNQRYQSNQQKLKDIELARQQMNTTRDQIALELDLTKAKMANLKAMEELYVANQKSILAVERLRAAQSAEKNVISQWALQDVLAASRNMIGEYKRETRMMGIASGVKNGELQQAINFAVKEVFDKKGDVDEAQLVIKAGQEVKKSIDDELLKRITAAAKMDYEYSRLKRDFESLVKTGTAGEGFDKIASSLATQLDTLRSDVYNRLQVAVENMAKIDQMYLQTGFDKTQIEARKTAMLGLINLEREQGEIVQQQMEIERQSGMVVKDKIDAEKKRANAIAATNKQMEQEIATIMRETDAKVRDAAATKGAAAAMRENEEGRRRIQAVISKYNIENGMSANGNVAIGAALDNVRLANEQEKIVKDAQAIADSARITAIRERESADFAQLHAKATSVVASEMQKQRDAQEYMIAHSSGGKKSQEEKLARMNADYINAAAQASYAQAELSRQNTQAITSEFLARQATVAVQHEQVRLDQLRAKINEESLLKQIQLANGQFGSADTRRKGFENAAAASAASVTAQGSIMGTLSKLSYLPGIGGGIGLLMRPLSLFSKELGKGMTYLTMAASGIGKYTFAMRTNRTQMLLNIATHQKLTAAQSMASRSTSLFAGTILNTPLFDKRGWAATAKTLQLSGAGMKNAMLAVAGAGGVAILALSVLAGWLASLGKDGGPMKKVAEWMEGLNAIREKSKFLEQKQSMVEELKNQRNDFENRRKYLLEELDYRKKTGQGIGILTQTEAVIIRQREQQLRMITLEGKLNSERMTKLNQEYNDTVSALQTLKEQFLPSADESHWEATIKMLARSGGNGAVGAAVIKEMAEYEKRIEELGNDIEEERFRLQQLRPAAVAALRAHEMMLDIENNTNDILMQEMTNSKRELALRTKQAQTLRRMTILTGGKSPYMKMLSYAQKEQSALNVKQSAEFKLIQMRYMGIKEDSDKFQKQQQLVDELTRKYENAQKESEKFNTSYTSYRKSLAQQIVDRIKQDKETADLTRKQQYLNLEKDAFSGRGGIAETERLQLEYANALKLKEEAVNRKRRLMFDSYREQYNNLLKTLDGSFEEAKRIAEKVKEAKEKYENPGDDASEEEMKKRKENLEKAKAEYKGVSNVIVQTQNELAGLRKSAMDAKNATLTEAESQELDKTVLNAGKNLASHWQKILDEMTNLTKKAFENIQRIQDNRMREIIKGERIVPDVKGTPNDLSNKFRDSINQRIQNDLQSFFKLNNELKTISPDATEFNDKLKQMQELQANITSNSNLYIDVLRDQVAAQQKAREATLQMVQSLMKFRSVAVDSVDAMSANAFSLRFRAFTPNLKLPTTPDNGKQKLSRNQEIKDSNLTAMENILARLGINGGKEAQKNYLKAVGSMENAAVSFKTSVGNFGRAVENLRKGNINVSINAVDGFGN